MMYEYEYEYILSCLCGSEKETCGSLFSPPTWVLEAELRWLGLCTKCFYPLSQLAGPSCLILNLHFHPE